MRATVLATLLVVAACEDVSLLLHPPETPLGEGLTGTYKVFEVTCDPSDVYPQGCRHEEAAIEAISARDPIRIEAPSGNHFKAYASWSGTGSIDVAAAGLTASFDVTVLPIVYTRLTWFDRYERFGPFLEHADVTLGPAFRGSEIELWQKHYMETREVLAETSAWAPVHVLLHGRSPFVLIPGKTESKLVPLEERPPYEDRMALSTGEVLGAARLTTEVGGELDIDVVDRSAIARLALWGYEGREPPGRLQLWGTWTRIAVMPLDDRNRPIAGCPVDGPVVFDEEELLIVSAAEVPESPFCEFLLEVRDWQDYPIRTTLVIEWNGASLRRQVAY